MAKPDLTSVPIEAPSRTSAPQVPVATSPAHPAVNQTAPTAAGKVESAQLTTMGYLHPIALVVTAGVVTGFLVAAGLPFSLVFDVPGAAVVVFVVDRIARLAILISYASA